MKCRKLDVKNEDRKSIIPAVISQAFALNGCDPTEGLALTRHKNTPQGSSNGSGRIFFFFSNSWLLHKAESAFRCFKDASFTPNDCIKGHVMLKAYAKWLIGLFFAAEQSTIGTFSPLAAVFLGR